jgi:hypothetical protein
MNVQFEWNWNSITKVYVGMSLGHKALIRSYTTMPSTNLGKSLPPCALEYLNLVAKFYYTIHNNSHH